MSEDVLFTIYKILILLYKNVVTMYLTYKMFFCNLRLIILSYIYAPEDFWIYIFTSCTLSSGKLSTTPDTF